MIGPGLGAWSNWIKLVIGLVTWPYIGLVIDRDRTRLRQNYGARVKGSDGASSVKHYCFVYVC